MPGYNNMVDNLNAYLRLKGLSFKRSGRLLQASYHSRLVYRDRGY